MRSKTMQPQVGKEPTQQALSGLSEETSPKPEIPQNGIEDYRGVLEQHQFQYRPVDYYYQVGEPTRSQGWILHLSCVWPKILDLLDTILPLLKNQSVPFKVVQNKNIANLLCNGNLGYHQLGKVCSIYPPDDETALILVKALLEITKDFKGCAIPTDFSLGGIIYTRYGSFNLHQSLGQNGSSDRYIQNGSGEWIKDEYCTPFRFPKGVPWPFQEIVDPVEEAPSSFLKERYRVFSTLKTDAKGRVMKSLRLHGLQVQWILIKEAKCGVCEDEQGRDIRDRLRWQYQLQSHLQGKAPVPKVYDFFQEKDDAYLVMEYIKGKPLRELIINIFQLSIWFKLNSGKKDLMMSYLIQLVETLEILHAEGYVHRDITPVNFILDRSDRLVAIDLELAYSLKDDVPNPPFKLGTPGFMSPEQLEAKRPEVNQDIYSLGAFMIKFFTNLSPVKFECSHSRLPTNINFFIRNEEISKLIASCLSKTPGDRPDLANIKSALENYKAGLNTPQSTQNDAPSDFIDRRAIQGLIQQVIPAFSNPIMVHPGELWHSNNVNEDEQLDNPQRSILYSIGFHSGVGGVMYTLAGVKAAGYDIESTREVYTRSLDYLRSYYLNALPDVMPGLYYGASGVALALAHGISVKLVGQEYRPEIAKCLEVPENGLDIAHGAAGRGLAILRCKEFINTKRAEQLLQHCVELLLENQQKDGSWFTIPMEGSRPLYYTGFSRGVAGICYFLLQYCQHNRDERVLMVIAKAMHWLRKKSKKNRKGIHWFTHIGGKFSEFGLNDGTAGIALCFINAYQILGDPSYKEIAENALRSNPECLVHSDFSWGTGITGLAQAYLAALEAFEDDEWRMRVDFIVNTLINVCRGDQEKMSYWEVEDNKLPTADLMAGNGGILYFLLKYLTPRTSSTLFELSNIA